MKLKPFGDFFSIMLKSCCHYLTMTKNAFYEFCFQTFEEDSRSEIGKERIELTEEAKRILNSGLSMSLDINTGNFNPSVPGFRVKDKESGGSAEAAKVRWNNYRKIGIEKGANTIDSNILIGLALVLCMMSTAHDKYSEIFDGFENGPFNNDELIIWLSDAVDYRNTYNIEKVKTDKQYLFPFLLGTLFYCRKWYNDEKKPEFNIVFWLDSQFNSLVEISNDAQIADFQREYYSLLWNTCKTLDIRDVTSGEKLSSISENAQIANLYTIPPFIEGGEIIEHPIDTSSEFSYLVVANTGCGKSTFLQAVVTANIFEKVSALQVVAIESEAKKRYQFIKEKFGFEENFFPILVKSNAVNRIEVEKLSSSNLLDISIGSQCDSFTQNIDYIIDNERCGRVILLVDALDEIDGSYRKELFGRIIEKFLNDHPKTNIILTSRAIDFRDFHGRNFYDKHIRISLGQFGNEEIKELISKWMTCDVSLAADADIEKKYRYFINNEYLAQIAPNPYILSHALHYQAYHVNATPQEIFSHVIDNLIEKRWPAEKYKEFGITTKYMREVLAYIAWNMAFEDEHIIPSNSIISWFCSASAEISDEIDIDRKTWDRVVKDMTARSGLIILEGIDYVFQNEVIEHYLASEWIISKYSNNWSQEQNTEIFVINELQNTISGDISGECWKDILIMMFSPDSNYVKVRLDKLTPALYKFLLLKSSETMSNDEIKTIGDVFLNVVCNTFGKNHITNDAYEHGREVRRQIARFLYNNSHIVGDDWKTLGEFQEALNYIRTNKIVNEIGE